MIGGIWFCRVWAGFEQHCQDLGFHLNELMDDLLNGP